MKRTIVILVLLLLAQGARAADHYVDSVNGNDTWSGTLSAPNVGNTDGPWQTLNKVETSGALITAGSTVYLAAGQIFNETVNGRFDTNANGVEGNPVIITRYGEGADPVISTSGVICVNMDAAGDNWITWRHIAFSNVNGGGGTCLLFISARTGVVCDSCTFTGGGSGLRIVSPVQNVIQDCTITNATANGCIVMTSGSVTFTGCEIASNGNDGIGNNGTATMVIDDCYIHDNTNDGISCHDSSTATISHSRFITNGDSEITQVATGTNYYYGNILIYHTGATGDNNGCFYASAGTHYLYNNVIYCAETDEDIGILAKTPGNASIVSRNNIVYGFATGMNQSAGTLDSDYDCVYGAPTPYAGIAAGAHSIAGDPLFVTPGSDFHLQAGSPCTNAGTDLGDSYDEDYAGDDQDLWGTGWEIGAYVLKQSGQASKSPKDDKTGGK